jgi:hypothetical protein
MATDIKTRWLMTTSALLLAVLGVALSFLPHEILALTGAPAAPRLVMLTQLGGAMALAWAILNWMSRGQRLGGIYNRPLALANVLHFATGSVTLLKIMTAGTVGPAEVVLVVPYVVLAVWWAAALVTSPV